MTNQKKKLDIDELIRQEKEWHESIKPVDVQVMFGDRILTVRIPYIHGPAFEDVANKYPVPRNASGAWFDLKAVTREHPDVVLIDGEETDDLYVARNKQIVYRWPEIFDALGTEDRENLEAVVWGLHVHEPRKRLAQALKAKAAARRAAEAEEVENG
jgi:hypothetical protein